MLFAGNGNKISCETIRNIATHTSSINEDVESFISLPLIYYFTRKEWNITDRILTVYSINTANAKKDSININIPNQITIDFLPSIAIDKDILILTDDEYFEQYRFVKTAGKYEFKNKLFLPPHTRFIRSVALGNNKFLFYTIYNHHPADSIYNTSLGIYDAQKDNMLKIIHPDLPCIGFSHLLNSWVTVNNEMIALAEPCGYKIILFDHSLNKIDSINYQPETNWNVLPNNKISCETDPSIIHPKLLIDKLQVLEDTVSRIEKIFFVNNSTLMVSSTGKYLANKKRRIDIWKIGKWNSPILTDPSFAIEYSKDGIIDLKDSPLKLNSTINGAIKDNLFYSFNSEDLTPQNNISIKEFTHQKDMYYENHDPKYSIGIYKIHLP